MGSSERKCIIQLSEKEPHFGNGPVIKVRAIGSTDVIKTLNWSYTYQNFAGDKPVSPVTLKTQSGIYKADGITGKIPFDKRTKK
jgi:hypothetical protein